VRCASFRAVRAARGVLIPKAMFTPRVLIVDDEAAVLASFARQFRVTGWEVMTTSNAKGAARLAAQHRPDLVLLDVDLGNLCGADVLDELKRNPATQAIAVAMITGAPNAQMRERCVIGGALGYLTKPLRMASIEALKKLVQNHHDPRVLLSDDDRGVLRALERAAQREGLEPTCEDDPRNIVGLAREICPQVIVLDVEQRGLDGRQVLAALKADPDTRDIRVVMLSGVEDQRTRHECLILGAEDYVVKPLDPLFFSRIARKLGGTQLN
jgi:two-component system response regulator AdeR